MNGTCLRVFAAMVLGAASLARADLTPGNYAFGLEHEGRPRSYIVHVPRDTLTNPWPVVINFHGSGSSAAGQQAYTGMDAIADREGFLAVYPNGTGMLAGHLLTWNAGPCCGYAQENAVDDVGFVRAMLADLDRHVTIDRSRIYATGLSNGAMMAYRLATEAPDLLAAIAPVAGALLAQPLAPSRPLPVLHIHSVDDTRALYRGGLGPPYPLTTIRVQHPSVEAVLSHWARLDGCPEHPRVDPAIRGDGPSRAHTATRITYGPCKGGVEVVLWRLTGAGHVWPGGAAQYLSRLLGSQSKILGASTDVIDANERMWQFFSAYRTDEPALPGSMPE